MNKQELSFAEFYKKHQEQELDIKRIKDFIYSLENNYNDELTLFERKEKLVIQNNVIFIILKWCNRDLIQSLNKYTNKKVSEYNRHMVQSEIEFFLDNNFICNIENDSICLFLKSNWDYIGSIALQSENDIYDYNTNIFNTIKTDDTFINSNYETIYISNIKEYCTNLVKIINDIKQVEIKLKSLKSELNKFKII